MSFVFTNNIEFYRDDLLKPIMRSAGRLAESDEAIDCTKQLKNVFKQWKAEHGEDPVQRGLMRASLIESFEAATPFQCAGYGVNNYTDLAFKLWLEDYKPFENLCEKYQLDGVLSVTYYLIDRIAKADHIDSLVRLSCLIYEREYYISTSMANRYRDSYYKEKKINAKVGLTHEARKKGANANKQKSEQAKTQFRIIGRAVWLENPRYNYKKLTNELYEHHNIPKNNKGDLYSITQVRKFIIGLQKEL